MSDQTELEAEFKQHLQSAAENASRDTDALVAKIATAGITAVVAIAGLTNAAPAALVAAGFCFGGSLIVSLVSLRISASALRWHASKYPRRPTAAYTAVTVLNYVALALLIAAAISAALAVSAVAIPTSDVASAS